MYAFDLRVSRGNILFDDGDLCEFNLGDPDISFLPRADLQWQLGSNLFGPGFLVHWLHFIVIVHSAA